MFFSKVAFVSLTVPSFPVDVLEDVKKAEFQIWFVARNLQEEHMSIILQTKNCPRGLQVHRYVEFSQNIGWEMMEMISLKMRNLGFEIFFEAGFSDGNDHATSQKIAMPFK